MSFITIWVSSPFELLTQFEFLSFVTIWVFKFVTIWVLKFCHNLSCHILSFSVFSLTIWVLSWFEFLSFVTIWDFEFCHRLSFWVFHHFSLSFITIWVFECHHNLSFWVSSQFVTIGAWSSQVLSQFKLSYFEFLIWFSYNLSIVTIWVFEFCINLRFWVLSQFELLSFVTILV